MITPPLIVPAAAISLRDVARDHDDRVTHAGQLGHELDQVDPPDVLAAEDVALARLAALRREQVTLGHVLDVHDVRGAVDDRGHPAADVVADDPRGGLAGLGAVHGHAQHVRRVDDHDVDPAPRPRRERLGLAFVLRVDVGHPEPAAAIDVVLASGAAVGSGARPRRRSR